MKTLPLIALMLTAVACGGSSKKTTAAAGIVACDSQAADQSCIEAPAASTTTADWAAACTDPAVGGTVVAACPATGRVGRCAVSQAVQGGTVSVVYHVYQPATAADGAAFCTTLQGAWTAG